MQDNTASDFNVGVSNDKSTNFNFQINPEVLPRFSLAYSTSIKDSEITANSNNTMNVQFSKNFKIQNSNLSTAVSYGDNSDNLTGKQSTNNAFNLSYGISLMDNKLFINTGYRVGNNYDVNNSINSLSESGNFSFGYKIFENLDINSDWTKNSSFSSESAKKDVNNSNSFRLNYVPIKNLSFALGMNFNENQTGDAIGKSTTKNFATRLPPILDIVNISYNYTTSETENTLTADNSLDFALDFGSLKISNFTSNVRYGTKKTKTIDTNSYSTIGNLGFNVNFELIENLRLSYVYNLDKTTSNSESDNKDATSNTINAAYVLKLMENLNCSVNTSYSNTQSLSAFSSNSNIDHNYNGSLDYRIGETSVSFAGSLSRSFDESGVHISQRTSIGPGISTKLLGTAISANASFGEDSSNGELNSFNTTNYSLNASYPFGKIGSSSLSYTVSSQENLRDPSSNSDSENISFSMSFNF